MMKIKPTVILLLLFPLFGTAQTDLLILKKKGMHLRTYTVGSEIAMKTVYDQWFDGMITGMRHDSIVVGGVAFHYKEIAAIRLSRDNFSNTVMSTGMMIAGGGIFVLGAVNGLYRGDKSKDWYTASGLITGAGLMAGGWLLTRTRTRTYTLGKKFTLDYLVLQIK